MQLNSIPGQRGAIDIHWDDLGIPHVIAEDVVDAYRGMGYAEGHERLWQIHLSCLFANGEAASVMGARFVPQDALLRTFGVPADPDNLPTSAGDEIVDAYLQGLNAAVDALTEIPPEFAHAGTEPRHFTRRDVASRYRFTNWFQRCSWPEKMFLGRLAATHGIDWIRPFTKSLTPADAKQIELLREPLRELSLASVPLVNPDFSADNLERTMAARADPMSGSNNWAVTGRHSRSGKPMLAMDPHQAFSIPNTFFYSHLRAGDWQVFGASFPGVPYFMMGHTNTHAWGLTTGMVDNFDVYVEQLREDQWRSADGWEPTQRESLSIAVAGAPNVHIEVEYTDHGPLIDSLLESLGQLPERKPSDYGVSIRWSLRDLPTAPGALARLPLARNAEEFGHTLFEDDVCPLVNNIICVDQQDHLRRFIAASLPARTGVTGRVPLAGWLAENNFRGSTEAEFTVETDPASGCCVTANDDTLGSREPFPVHNFPGPSARADRIRELLNTGGPWAPADFERMQLDLLDTHARGLVKELLPLLEGSGNETLDRAYRLLAEWDWMADADSAAAALFYTFTGTYWHRRLIREVLQESLAEAIPTGVPNLTRFNPSHFLVTGSPWIAHSETLTRVVRESMLESMQALSTEFGEEPWSWGRLHGMSFGHSLRRHQPWAHLQLGPDPIGGSGNTLAMAGFRGPGPGVKPRAEDFPCRAWIGPAYRLVVDLADPDHCRFVICGGNSGRTDSSHVLDHYPTWLAGEYFTVTLDPSEFVRESSWQFRAQASSKPS